MKIIPSKAVATGYSASSFAEITTQVSNSTAKIYVSKPEIELILSGYIQFIPNSSGNSGIGTLQIGGQSIHTLEREFRSDWHKIVQKLCKMIELPASDVETALSNQPVLAPKVKDKKSIQWWKWEPPIPQKFHEGMKSDPKFQELSKEDQDWYLGNS